MISDKKNVQDLVRLLTEHGLNQVIITPGSRNAPFSVSLHDHPEITAHSIVDERSAAFVALGMAQQLKKPVVLICTSGTAALNFAPAIAEAYYQRTPLLVITADRPIEWIDQGEGQSIRQREVYRNYVKASYEIAEEANEGDLVWYNVRIMDEAIRKCTEGIHGPVHINFPLRESLYKTVEDPQAPVKRIETAHTIRKLAPEVLLEAADAINHSPRVMVLAGQMLPDSRLADALCVFSSRPNVVVLTEAHSNLSGNGFVTTIDRMIMGLSDEEADFLVPDILITIGLNIISRKIKDYIRKRKTIHWHVDISGDALDTLKHLVRIYPVLPAEFFEGLNAHSASSSSNYRAVIQDWNQSTAASGAEFLESAPWSDLKVFDRLCKNIPAGYDFQMGNSSAVRYILLSDARSDLRYFGNRGVAGIDGCTSTAIGAAFAGERPTTLVTGDIGFFYDSNAFWNDIPKDGLRVVVINNGGGGIFRIIEGPASTGKALDKYFETSHERTAEKMAAMYEVLYRSASDEGSLDKGLEWLYSTAGPAILEVHTPRLENDKVLKNYFAAIRKSILIKSKV